MSSSPVSAKPEVQHDDSAGLKAPTTGQKIKAWIRRFWWVGVLVGLVLVAILVPVILLVVYPHIAQNAVDDTSIVLLAQTAYNPTPSSIGLYINDTFIIKSSYHPTLYSFNASLYLDEDATTPFVSFNSSQIDNIKNGSTSAVNETVPIVNQDEFAAFTKKALESDEFHVMLKGKGKLKQSGLPKTTVTYDQKVYITGLNGLTQLTVTDIALLNETLSDGSNAQGTTYLYNPSVLTLSLGNVTLGITGPSPNYTDLGTSTLVNAVLSPGNNSLQTNIVSNVVGIASIITQDSRYGCAKFPVTITGINSTVDGVDIPYYTASISSLNLTTELDLSSTLEDAGYGSLIGTCESS